MICFSHLGKPLHLFTFVFWVRSGHCMDASGHWRCAAFLLSNLEALGEGGGSRTLLLEDLVEGDANGLEART